MKKEKPISISFNRKKATLKTQKFYILLGFLLVTTAILIAVSIYWRLIKYRAKQKHLLPFHFTNNKLKEIIYQKYKSKMSNKVTDIDTKNRTCYFFNDIINIKHFGPNNIKIDEKSYKNILIYYIRYVTIKDLKYLKINSANPLSLFSAKWMDTLKTLIKVSI